MRPPSSQWIPTRLTSSLTSSYSAPASISIQLQLSWVHLRSHSFAATLSSLSLQLSSVLSRFRCNGHSLLLGSYLSRIGRIEYPSCSACGHSSQDTSHLILHCPATDSLRCSLFGDSVSLYDLWSRPWRIARLLGLHGLPPCPHPSEGFG